VTSGRRNCSKNRKIIPYYGCARIPRPEINSHYATLRRKAQIFVDSPMSGLFEAWKPESGARITGRIKMAESSVSGTDILIVVKI